MAGINAHTSDEERKRRTRRLVLTSAAFGQFAEFYDFVVYAYTASTIAVLFFPAHDDLASLLSTFAVYAVGFGMRPFGGLLFGHLGDRVGRRGVLAAIILLMGGSTALIGVLPTHDRIGIWAPVLLVLARLVQGLSVGGEAIGSNALVAEHAPPGRRGAYVAFGYAWGVVPAVFAAFFVLGLKNGLGADTFASWGWRIPFLLGGVIALIGIFMRRSLAESPAFESVQHSDRVSKAPLLEAFKYPRSLGFAFAIATLSGLGFYSLTGFYPSYLTVSVKMGTTAALASNGIALVVMFVAMPLSGALSDRIGRRPILTIGAGASAVVAYPASLLVTTGSFIGATLGQALLAAALGVFFGAIGIVWLELFPTRARFSGAAMALNAAYVAFGGSAPYFSTWLVDHTGSLQAPNVYLAILAAVVFVVTFFIPETLRSSLVKEEDAGRDSSIVSGTDGGRRDLAPDLGTPQQEGV
jgi:MFS transporter, MHS family, proline/betaine transporter